MLSEKVYRLGSRILRKKIFYLEWAGTSILALLGFYADANSVFGGINAKSDWLSAGGLIVFGSLNILLIQGFTVYRIRYRRAQRAYESIHLVAEEIRNLRGDSRLSRETCLRAIHKVCFRHIDAIMTDFVGFKTCITLKYVKSGLLVALRSENQAGRYSTPENAADNLIFSNFTLHDGKYKVMHVTDIENQPCMEKHFGVAFDSVLTRAKTKYRSFLALPIRKSNYTQGELSMRQTIGILGIDSSRPCAFEDLEPGDYQALYSVVDILAEAVLYLQGCPEVENAPS